MKKFKYLYGPVSSWRLGSSLGVDLLSGDKKLCSFGCAYCQVGDTPHKTKERTLYVPAKDVMDEIKGLPPDLRVNYVTLSGKGEPTLVKNLADIILGIRSLRKEKIAVITNASFMWDKSVRRDLALADLVMAKLDACDEKSFNGINRPAEGITFADVYAGIKAFRDEHKTKLALQVMFFEANKNEVEKLAGLAFGINPAEIEINTPLRPCAALPLSKEEIGAIKKYFEEFGRKAGSKAKIVSVYNGKRKKVAPINERDTAGRRGGNHVKT